MNKVRVDFASLAWEETAAGARSKAFVRGDKKLRLVEFTSEFREADWCVKAHVGCVLEGALEIVFDERTESFAAGDGIFIEGGERERHRAKVVGSPVKLLLVEDAS
jgi:hypothetical protein